MPRSWNAEEGSPSWVTWQTKCHLGIPNRSRLSTGEGPGWGSCGDPIRRRCCWPPMALAMYSASLWVSQPTGDDVGAVSGDDLPQRRRQHRGGLVDEVHLRSELAQFLHDHFGLGFQHRRVRLELVEEQMKWVHRLVWLVGEASFLERGDHFSHYQTSQQVVGFGAVVVQHHEQDLSPRR